MGSYEMKHEELKVALRELKEMEEEGLLEPDEARREKQRLLDKWQQAKDSPKLSSWPQQGAQMRSVKSLWEEPPEEDPSKLSSWPLVPGEGADETVESDEHEEDPPETHGWLTGAGESDAGSLEEAEHSVEPYVFLSLSHAALEVSQHFKCERREGELRISWWWYHTSGSIFGLLISVAFTIMLGSFFLLGLRTLFSGNAKVAENGIFLTLLVQVGFGVGFLYVARLAYASVLEVFGHTTIELNTETLTIRNVPLPMFWTPPFWSRSMRTAQLKGFHQTEKVHHGKMGHSYRYRLWMRDQGGGRQLVIGIEMTQGVSDFLQATLEHHLRAIKRFS